jgi:hypothetical protein
MPVTRVINGQPHTWDGQQWQSQGGATPSVDNPVSFGAADYVPGARDVLNLPVNAVKGIQALPDVLRGFLHEPAATLKGFAQGASEAATPQRVGLLGLLTGGATLPAALGAAGGEAVAQGVRAATDAPNKPTSLTDAATQTAEAGAVPGLAAAVPGIANNAGTIGRAALRVGGAGIGGYEGYKYGGPVGAVGGAIAGGSLAGGGSRMRGLKALQTLFGNDTAATAGEEAAAVRPVTPSPESPITPFTQAKYKVNPADYAGVRTNDTMGGPYNGPLNDALAARPKILPPSPSEVDLSGEVNALAQPPMSQIDKLRAATQELRGRVPLNEGGPGGVEPSGPLPPGIETDINAAGPTVNPFLQQLRDAARLATQ